MKIYNTLHRKNTDLKPIAAGEIKLYTCGPTVYDYQHIGNFRTFIFEDLLRRVLETHGYKVKHTMNITDVGHLVSDADEGEDKLEKGAKREGKTAWDVANYYTERFLEDATKLNILPPNAHKESGGAYSRATDFIDDQLAMVQILLDKEFAYITDSAIYFDVSKLPSYGELTGQKLADKATGVRDEVVVDASKRNPHDFAIWFFTVGRFSDHSMHWPSPWGEGFPGWHLECSAIIHAVLGDPIDIHTGGVDNIGTHHVNEMAQTEAAFGHRLASYWMHSEHLMVDGAKMAKSKGSFYTLQHIEDKGFDPLAFRLLVLQSHYRSHMNFTWQALQDAQNRLTQLRAWADLKHQPNVDEMSDELDDLWGETLAGIKAAVADDLDTPKALARLSKQINFMEEHPIPRRNGKNTGTALQFLDELFGLNLDGRPDITPEQKQLLESRQKARDNKDFSEADRIRDELKAQGLEIKDMSFGQIWSRV